MDHFEALTLKQLRALAAVVAEGGVTAAAATLNVTPPAVSTQLRNLEANVGVPLLGRDAAGRMVATPAGTELLAAARRIETTLSQCRNHLSALRGGKAGRASLGVVSTGKYFAPRIVALARRLLPGIEVSMRIGNRGEIVQALDDGAVDLAVMGRPPRVPLADATPLGPHPYVLVVPPDHPCAGRRDIPPQLLLGETFLTREPGSGTRLLTERFLDQIGDGRIVETLEFGSNETIKQGVMAGLGVALISGHTVAGEVETGRLALVCLPGLPIMRNWFVVSPREREEAPATATLARFLVERREDYLPRADLFAAYTCP